MFVEHRRRFLVFAAVTALLLIASACGGSDSDDSDPTTAAPAAGATTTAATDAPAGTTEGPAATTAAPETSPPASGGDRDLSLVPPGEKDILGNPAGQGFVEIDGTRYDFILNGACAQVFGALQASGNAADGSDVRVDALIPPNDWETDTTAGWDPPYVEIEIDSTDWRAEAGYEKFIDGETKVLSADESAVTSFINEDGVYAEGTANFVNEFGIGDLETASGSFAFYCPEG